MHKSVHIIASFPLNIIVICKLQCTVSQNGSPFNLQWLSVVLSLAVKYNVQYSNTFGWLLACIISHYMFFCCLRMH